MTRSNRFPSIPVFISLCAALLLPSSAALALAPPGPLERLGERDLEALETLATYPEPLREAALRASTHADLLVEMQRLQDRSSDAFHQRISELDPDLQEQLWELVRVPGLLTQLGEGEPPSDAKLNQIAKRNPEAEAAIWSFGRLRHGLLVDLLKIHRGARDRFDALTSELPQADREAFHLLVEEPELVSILTQRVRLAVHLGESFRESPRATRAHLAALSKEVAARNAAAEADWEQGLEGDPEAAAELKAASLAYAEECDCEVGSVGTTQVIHEVRVVHAYPYWFGYPAVYAHHPLHPYGYWRPYHHYHGPHFGYGFHLSFALPAVGFLHWFFDGGHHDHYGHLSHRLNRHYRSHARARSASYGLVGRWARGYDRARHPRRAYHSDYAPRRRHSARSERPFFAHRRNGHGDRVERPRRNRGDGGLVGRWSREFESRIDRPRRRGGDGERSERRRDRESGDATRSDLPRRRRGGEAAPGNRPRRDGERTRGDRSRRTPDVAARPPGTNTRHDRRMRPDSPRQQHRADRNRADRRGGDRKWRNSGSGSQGPRAKGSHDRPRHRAARANRGGGGRRDRHRGN